MSRTSLPPLVGAVLWHRDGYFIKSWTNDLCECFSCWTFQENSKFWFGTVQVMLENLANWLLLLQLWYVTPLKYKEISVWALQIYSHVHQFVVMLKRPQKRHQKHTKMSNNCKAKLCGVGLEAKLWTVLSQPLGARGQFQAWEYVKKYFFFSKRAHSFSTQF